MSEYTGTFTDTIVVENSDEWESVFPERIETDELVFSYLLEDATITEAWDFYSSNFGNEKFFNTSWRCPQTYQDTIDTFEDIRGMFESNTDMFYSIRSQSGELIGQATIEDVDLHTGRCGIGIWLDESFWGQGLAQERAEGFLYAIFKEMPVDTVEIRVAVENTPSIKSVLKYLDVFGGSFEGCFRNISINPYRERLNMFVWSITETEFFDDDAEYSESVKKPSANIPE